MKIRCSKAASTLAFAATLSAGTAAAGTLTVRNGSSIMVPQTRVYKTCLGAFAAQVFATPLEPGAEQTVERTSPVLGACVWAREVGIEPQQVSCFAMTTDLPDPSEPDQITVTWFGSSADDLGCAIAVGGPPAPGNLSAPTGLMAAPTAGNGGPAVQLSWTDHSVGEQTYAVERRTDGAIFVGMATLDADTTGFLDVYATGGHTYTYRVRACTSGGCSPFSNEASITIAP
jgi:hypothetical protein